MVLILADNPHPTIGAALCVKLNAHPDVKGYRLVDDSTDTLDIECKGVLSFGV